MQVSFCIIVYVYDSYVYDPRISDTQCVAACCSVLQRVAVCCSALQRVEVVWPTHFHRARTAYWIWSVIASFSDSSRWSRSLGLMVCVCECMCVLKNITAYEIWSVISSISNLDRWCRSLGFLCHVPLKSDQWDRNSSVRLYDPRTLNTLVPRRSNPGVIAGHDTPTIMEFVIFQWHVEFVVFHDPRTLNTLVPRRSNHGVSTGLDTPTIIEFVIFQRLSEFVVFQWLIESGICVCTRYLYVQGTWCTPATPTLDEFVTCRWVVESGICVCTWDLYAH